ncbi:unnamed protein product, partial [Effrenium voratum]
LVVELKHSYTALLRCCATALAQAQGAPALPHPEVEEDDDDVDGPGVRTLEMGVLMQGYVYRAAVDLPSNGQLVEVVGPLPAGIEILVKDEGSPEHPAALWVEAELKQLGVFYHGAAAFAPLRSAFAASAHVSCREWASGLIVRIAGGEFAEVVVNLKACVMGPREGRPSKVYHNVELIRALAREELLSCELSTKTDPRPLNLPQIWGDSCDLTALVAFVFSSWHLSFTHDP